MFPQPTTMLPDDAGTTTVEYAVITIVAAVLAAVLYAVVSSDSVYAKITGLIESALTVNF